MKPEEQKVKQDTKALCICQQLTCKSFVICEWQYLVFCSYGCVSAS